MLDMLMTMPGVEAGGFKNPKQNAMPQGEKTSFSDVVKTVVEQLQGDSETNTDLSLLIDGLDPDVAQFFVTDEEVDFVKLMELLAGFGQTLETVDYQNLNVIDDETANLISNIQTVVADVVSSGIDISELTPEQGKELFQFFQTATDEEKANVSLEFGKVVATASNDDTESQMNLLNSFSNKSFEIRNVADESDNENQVFNIMLDQSDRPALIQEMPTTQIPTNPEMFNQISNAIVENTEELELGSGEFIMKLNPEELGEVTIKLVNDGVNSVLEITASSQNATKLINNDLNILRDVFRPLQIEVRDAEIAVAETQGSQMQGFDMQQQNFNQNGNNFNQEGFVSYGNNGTIDEEISVDEVNLDDLSNLNIYI